MYLHIGKDKIINKNDLIGIFDIESIKETEEYSKIIEKLKLENSLINLSNKTEKSLIITKENKKTKGYISNIYSMTLLKRVQ